jgi:hypothetical protein
MTHRAVPQETFSSLLQEKLDELDAAAEHEALLVHDEVEQLRLHAAYLVSRTDGKPWHTGAEVRFQGDVSELDMPPPTLDISYPARPTAPSMGASAGPGRDSPVAVRRQGRRVPG